MLAPASSGPSANDYGRVREAPGFFSFATFLYPPVAIGGVTMIVGALFAGGLWAPVLATIGAGLAIVLGPIGAWLTLGVSWLPALLIVPIYGIVIPWIWHAWRTERGA